MERVSPRLTYRTIDPAHDAELAVGHQIDACIATFGTDAPFQGRARYLRWLASKVEEFPEGFLLAFLDGRCVGQLELEVPYGLERGYVNLFYLTPQFRGIGFGPLLHERADRYFHSWEATSVRLHVSPTNRPALRFYRRMGYVRAEGDGGGRLWEMIRTLGPPADQPHPFPGARRNSG